MKNKRHQDRSSRLIDLGSATKETRALTYGADDSKGGLWLMPGLSLD